MKTIFAIATMDTKAAEIEFVAQCLRNSGVQVKTVDVGTLAAPSVKPDINRQQVLDGFQLSQPNDRGQSVTEMGEALGNFLNREMKSDGIDGVIGIGGSGGTALITAAMRTLPIGLPKVMVSTVASGQTAPYVDCMDITMMFSVVDVAGLNHVSKTIFSNAAHAIAGMAANRLEVAGGKECLGMTMFGVTTPCVTQVKEHFEEEGYDCLVFHAVGTGGRAMEGLVQNSMIRGVLDITTTEIADEIVGGVFASGPRRFEATVESGIPFLLSVGAIDMVNFGGIESVPESFRNRNLHVHNAQVTLMRTSVEENVAIGRWIARKLNRSKSGFTLLLPEGGVSLLDAPGQPFYDPEADAALFETLESEIEFAENRKLVRLASNINDPEFSKAICSEFEQLINN